MPPYPKDMPANLRTEYSRIIRRRLLFTAAIAAALLVSFAYDVSTGPSIFPIKDLIHGLFDPASLSAGQKVILFQIRIPQAILAVLVGIALGLSGAETQTVLNNPLASPYTLGLTSAATVGAAIAIVFEINAGSLGQHVLIPLFAFICTLAASLLIQMLAKMFGSGIDMLILFGIALVFLCNALVSLLQFIADSSALQQLVFWTMGSVARATWPKLAILGGAILILSPISFANSWKMTALRAGEDQAAGLGISVERLRLLTLVRVSLLSALAVSFAGSIGFIGLVGPHLARLALGEDHRFYLPGSALAGALVLSLASIAGKMIVPGVVVPIGIVTALVGIPLLIALLIGQRRTA